MDKISIIIPTYNSGKYIKRCLDSVCNQTYKNLEIIIVDNGSKDNTVQLCQEYEKKDSRIISVQTDVKGVSVARNKGLEIASGKYIQFIDSDDAVKEDMISKLYDNMKKTNADVVICGYEYVRENSVENHKLCNHKSGVEDMLTSFLCKPQYEGLFNYLWNKLYKSEIIKENGVKFNEDITLAEDALFNMELYRCCENFTYIEECLYLHYDNQDSLEKQKKDIYVLKDTYFNIGKKYEQLYNNLGLNEKYKGMIGNKYLYYSIVLLDTLCLENNDSKLQKQFVADLISDNAIMKRIKNADCYNMNYKMTKFLLCMKLRLLVLWFTKLKVRLKK